MNSDLYFVEAYDGNVRLRKNVKILCSNQPYKIAHAKFKKAVESNKYENVVIGEEENNISRLGFSKVNRYDYL